MLNIKSRIYNIFIASKSLGQVGMVVAYMNFRYLKKTLNLIQLKKKNHKSSAQALNALEENSPKIALMIKIFGKL